MKLRMRRASRWSGCSKTSFSISSSCVLELLHLRPVVVDHRVDDPIQQHARPLAEEPIVLVAEVVDLAERPRHARMHRHQVLRAEEEVDVLGLEAVLRGREVDAVQDQIEVVAVGFDLGMVRLAHRVFDGELVEVKHVGEDARLLRGRAVEVDPHPDPAARLEPGGVHLVDRLGGTRPRVCRS